MMAVNVVAVSVSVAVAIAVVAGVVARVVARVVMMAVAIMLAGCGVEVGRRGFHRHQSGQDGAQEYDKCELKG